MDTNIMQILDKKADSVTAEETCLLDNWLTEASSHDCDRMRHCTFCFFMNKVARLLGQIEQLDDMREQDLEQVLLETEGECAVN